MSVLDRGLMKALVCTDSVLKFHITVTVIVIVLYMGYWKVAG